MHVCRFVRCMRTDIIERRTEIEAWIAEGRSKSFICRELCCKAVTLDGYLARFGIEYRGSQGGRGKVSPLRRAPYEYLSANSTMKSYPLRLRLLRDGVKAHECEV